MIDHSAHITAFALHYITAGYERWWIKNRHVPKNTVILTHLCCYYIDFHFKSKRAHSLVKVCCLVADAIWSAPGVFQAEWVSCSLRLWGAQFPVDVELASSLSSVFVKLALWYVGFLLSLGSWVLLLMLYPVHLCGAPLVMCGCVNDGEHLSSPGNDQGRTLLQKRRKKDSLGIYCQVLSHR